MVAEQEGEIALTDKILADLALQDGTSTLDLARNYKEDHQKVVGAVKSIQSLGDLITTEQKSVTKLEVTSEGKRIIKVGSHEAVVFEKVPPGDKGVLLKEIALDQDGNKSDELTVGFNNAIQNGWLKVSKDVEGSSIVVRNVDAIQDQTRESLKAIINHVGDVQNVDQRVVNPLKKRKLVTSVVVNYFLLWRSKEFTTSVVKLEAELTSEMVASGEYEKKIFKPYNFKAMGTNVGGGHLHPLMMVRTEFISILTEMGFSEMPTNRFVESSFWNFDALFVPQKHPARDVQDTFFISRPSHCRSIPEDYMERVRKVHSEGDFGSTGYKTDWKKEETTKNIMRTHTTAISARVLYELAQNKPFQPVKKFSIDRVFRNETLDATHLAEFHQVEGFVADRNLSLGHLIGVMMEFFRRLGIDQLRFKPAFNPYTEPSMEVFAYHKGLKKWVEVGNSGVFRPEMLLPMGLPEDVRVIAWGLSLERPTMIRYGIDNIRSLVGSKVDLKMVYNNPICRLDTI